MRLPSRSLAAVIVAGAVLAGACGSSAESTDPIAVPTTTSAPAPGATTAPDPPPAPAYDIDEVLARDPMVTLNVTPPMPAGANLPLPPGMADFDDLFTEAGQARWAEARARVDVFRVHAWQVRHFLSDEQLRVMIGYLDDHGIPLMFETEPLQPPDPAECAHTESFEGPYDLEMAQRIHDLGGTIAVVAIEEPYHFAHKLQGPDACNYTVERIVDEVIDYMRQMRAIFPDVPVGTIEPIWASPTTTPEDMEIWLDTYEERAGESFAFLHIDPNWYYESWPEIAVGIEAVADARGVPFGVLYNGGTETSSRRWMDFLMENVATLERDHGSTPQHISFQSWVDQPELALPDDDPAALTSAIVRYDGSRTVIEGSADDAGNITVTLTADDGAPVEAAPVTATLRSQAGALSTISVTGTVPAGVTEAIVLVRTNVEDTTPGSAQLRIAEIGYTDGDDPTDRIANGDFVEGLTGWAAYGEPMGRVSLGNGDGRNWITIDAEPDEIVFIDGPTIPVIAGSAYELRATVGIPPDSVGTTTISLEFVGGGRANLFLAPGPLEAIDTTTSPRGVATFDLGALDPGPYRIEVDYAGDLDNWPATFETTIEVP
ncbi:MAG: hypothetical protein R2707_18065 [Acidimicrobiales bacterium]